MRKVYNYLPLLLIVLMSMVACSEQDEVMYEIQEEVSIRNGKEKKGDTKHADQTITISVRLDAESFAQGEPGLILTDNNGNEGDAISFVTEASTRSIIVWKLAANSGIDRIVGIRAKDGHFDIFPPKQPRLQRDGSWQGRIKHNSTANEEAYFLDIEVDGKLYSIDPLIRVNDLPGQE